MHVPRQDQFTGVATGNVSADGNTAATLFACSAF
jgi:hypothetical protein